MVTPMRDLEFLRQGSELPALIVYRYRVEALRRAVRAHIQHAVAAGGHRLFSCEPNDFVMRLKGGGFFSSTDEAPFLDLGVFPSGGSSSPAAADETERDLELGAHHFDLKSILMIAQERIPNLPTAVVFIDATDKSNEQWEHERTGGELLIDGAANISKAEIPVLVEALAPGLSREETTELRRLAFAAWKDGLSFSALCDQVETAAVCALTKRKSGVGGIISPRPTLRVPLGALRDLVFGEQQERLRVISSVLKPHGSGADAFRELVLLTMRLLPVPVGASDAADVRRWVNWLAVLLRHAEALWSAGDRKASMWPTPDWRAPVLFRMLEEFHHLRDRASLGWRGHELRIETGARWLATALPDLSDRILKGLRQLELYQREAVQAPGEIDGDLWASIERWLTSEPVEAPTTTSKEPAPPRLTAFSELIGQASAKFVFLQPFDARKEDERAYARPLLLIGPNGVGKRIAASLMGSLFICETATAASPVVCGKCDGCNSAAMRLVDVDATDLGDADAARDFVKERTRTRGTLGGSPVTILHHVDRLPDGSCEQILKTVESAFGTGLKIFTARDRTKVHDALRSRCLVVHLWPLRPEEQLQLSRQYGNDGAEISSIIA